MSHPYLGRTAALTTKHGKGEVLKNSFMRMGVELRTIEVDTDQLGTFSGEIPRISDQRSTAITKARLGMKECGLALGLGSEGSIGSDHQIPFLNSDIETLVWIDDELGIEVVQNFRSLEIVAFREELNQPNVPEEIIARADFPNHALIVHAPGGPIYKGITRHSDLQTAVESALRGSVNGTVILESDLRAHMSPSRRANIERCGELLVARLMNQCPECTSPGFGEVELLFGLPCESCGELVDQVKRGSIFGCARCDYREEKLLELGLAAARNCSGCNP
jgi:hypothetical protein